MNRSLEIFVIASSLILTAACDSNKLPILPGPSSWLITNAMVVDGTGADAFLAAVRIEGDKILAVGELTPLPDESLIDAKGMILAPGFIDPHSHADEELTEMLDSISALSQGITTVAVGLDGFSKHPISDYFSKLEAKPPSINVASFSGHNTLRNLVLGKDYRRKATEQEVKSMISKLKKDMASGVLGLSTGLEYEPGIYSSTEEVIALARSIAPDSARYITHIRSEDRWFEDAIQEAIDIGKAAKIPVHISHLKLASSRLLGTAPTLLKTLDSALANGIIISADIYPYTAWQSTMLILIPDRDPKNQFEITKALNEIAPPESILFSYFAPYPSYIGKTLREISDEIGEDPVTVFSSLAKASKEWTERTGEPGDLIIAGIMDERDILELMSWPNTSIGTDASLKDKHPRGKGTYPKILSRYVREKRAMSLETAIYKMTYLPAKQLGITNRGLIKPGAYADLLLLDPENIKDNATMENPSKLSEGILAVWVNGQPTFGGELHTGRFPGRIIRRGDQ